MKKQFLITILLLGMIASLLACGSKEEASNMNVESTELDTTVNVSENTESVAKSEMEDNTVVTSIEQEDNQYKEQKDIFVLEYIDVGDGTEIDMTNREVDEKKYTIPESIDIYSYFGTYAGYTKPDIYVGSVSRFDGWVSICFAQSSFLAKAEDFDRVAVAKEETKEIENIETVQTVPISDSNTQVVSEPVTESSVSETPATTESDKYTPEEAIAVYRSLMEAGGIIWDPSLKNGGSWGTGWIYLEKGQPEWCASTDLESFAMGDSVGNPWTHFYLEVTGSDENAVYITEWAD